MKLSLKLEVLTRRVLRTVQELEYQVRSLVETSEVPNQNGKRQMVSIHRSKHILFDNNVFAHSANVRHSNSSHTNSSPRSVPDPIGPNRLTLPPTHQQPTFISREHHSDDAPQLLRTKVVHSANCARPGSRRFAEYASPSRLVYLPKFRSIT